MAEKTVSILRAIGNPNKAKIIAHLAKHRGETAEGIGKHLGYPLPTVYKYLRELEAATDRELVWRRTTVARARTGGARRSGQGGAV